MHPTPTSKASEDPPATTQLGITLRGLRKLREQFAAKFSSKYVTTSTEEICKQFVMDVTKKRQCRLAEVPELVASEDLGEPLYFISHAWGNSFEGLCCAIETFLASADEKTRVWIDLIAVNQHDGSPCKKEDMKAFDSVIDYAKAGTFVVTDRTNLSPASRAWCLYEWAYTLSAHGPDGLHMSLDPKDRTDFIRDLDIDKAHCKHLHDKARIIDSIMKQHGSVEAFNTKLRLQLLLEPLSYRVDLRRLTEAAKDTCWRLGAVQYWLHGGGRLLCISGGAGEGKSTVAAVLCSLMAPPAPQQQQQQQKQPQQQEQPQQQQEQPQQQQEQPQQQQEQPQQQQEQPQQQQEQPQQQQEQPQQQQEQPQQSCGFSGCVTVHHFLKYSDQRRLDPVRIVKSLAFQLACRIPSLAEYLLRLDSLEVVQLADVEAAVELLLRKPLNQMNCTPPGVVMLIDALDEADPPSLQLGSSGSSASPPLPMCPLVRGNRALELLTAHLAKLPPWVRFIVTTRPEAAAGQVLPCLRRTFTAAGGADGVTVLAPGDLRAAGPEAGSMAAARGGGDKCGDGGGCADVREVMLYHTAAAVLASYQQPQTPCTEEVRQGDNPKPRTLQDVYRLYYSIFEASFKQRLSNDKDGAIASCGFSSREGAVSEVLAVLLAAQEPPSQSLMQQLGLGPLIPLLPGYQDLFFVDEHHVYLFHKSLATWLLDLAQSGPFAPQVARGHALIGLHLAEIWKLTRAPQAVKYVVHHLAAAIAAAEAADAAGGSDPHPDSGSAVDAPAAASSTPATSSNRGIAGGRLRTTSDLQREAEQVLDALLSDFEFISAALAAGHGHGVISGLASIPMARGTKYSYEVLRWLRSEQHRLAGKSAEEIAQAVTGGFGVAVDSRLYEAAVKVACNKGCWMGMVLPRSKADWSESVAVLRPGSNCTFSPDGRQLASFSLSDSRIYVWDVATGHLTATLTSDVMQNVHLVVFSHGDGRAIASASEDGTVHIWDTATGSCTAVISVNQKHMWCSVAFSPHNTNLLAITSGDNTVELWNVQDLEHPALQNKLEGHKGSVTDLAFSRAGVLASCSLGDNTVRLWDTTSGRCIRELGGPAKGGCIAFSPTDDNLLAIGDGSTVILLDVSCEKEAKKLLKGESEVYCVAFSPCGTQLASGSVDATIRVWDVGSGKCAVLRGHTGEVASVAFSPVVCDTPLLASGGCDGDIRILELAGPVRAQQQSAPVGSGGGGGELRHGEGHKGAVWCVAFSKLDSDWLASGGFDFTVRLWSISTGQRLAVLEGHRGRVTCLAFSPVTRSQLANGFFDGTVQLWDGKDDNIAAAHSVKLTGHGGQVLCLAFTEDGKLLASGDEHGEVRVWDVAQRQCTRVISTDQVDEEDVIETGQKDVSNAKDVSSLAFSPGDNMLLCTGSWEEGVKVWDLTTGQCLGHVLGLESVEVAFPTCMGNNGAGTGGLVLYFAGCAKDKEGGLKVYELKLHTPQLKGAAGQPSKRRRTAIVPRLLYSTMQYDHPLSLAVSPCGRLLAVSDDTGRVSLLKLEAGERGGVVVVELGGKGFPPARGLAFSPSAGLTLACGYDDYTVRVWEPAEGNRLNALFGRRDVSLTA